jgi:hypothetical protein
MIEITNIPSDIFTKAKNFEKFRNDCKTYLQKANLNFDKFTIVEHDSFIGYITEIVMGKYIEDNYKDVKVYTWEKEHNISEIISILKDKDFSEDSKSKVKEYFYDKWDIKISIDNKIILCDVKTALTKKEPNKYWEFLYPVIQANKQGKDIMLLVYYVVNDIKNIESLKKIVVVGAVKPEDIKKNDLIKKGEITRFGTKSQIDNYITKLSVDYVDLKKIIENGK